ncbi:MAG: rhodanese-like domain-containing protein [Rubrivivax sp.]
MKFLLDNWILILMALTSGTLLALPSLRGGRGGGIGTSEAVRLINQEKAVLVDVCEPAEYAAGHAAGARNIPLGSLEGAKGLPTNKALPIIVMCASGARSARAAAQLRKAGHEKAVALAGGNAAWREANLPMEKGEKNA